MLQRWPFWPGVLSEASFVTVEDFRMNISDITEERHLFYLLFPWEVLEEDIEKNADSKVERRPVSISAPQKSSCSLPPVISGVQQPHA